LYSIFLSSSGDHPSLLSFPTRRSSDLPRARPCLPLSGGDAVMNPPLPIVALTGFLGSGKTTLLRRWRRDVALKDSAVIVHDLSRSEEHTSELQSRENLVCRLLLEKKKY